LVGYGAVDYVQSTSAVRDSVEAEATVTEAGVETRSVSTGTGSEIKYQPVVTFTDTYEGDDLFAGSAPARYETESAARNAISGYEPGTKTTVYVDPDDPEPAFLRSQPSGRQFVFIVFGSILALFGGLFVVRRYREEHT
jgi:hypothetical protein